ncbi:FxsA family protein [Wolinella succinogenes]|uniref:FxsA family protein n=1 Tax=Wolinella succinogenes TaxID=844 RepID=UPI002409479E|nr:FxsA family protein [Wolinella succinogenes]
MPWWILLGYLFLEVLVTLELGEAIGGVGLFAEIILSGLVGGVILVNFRYSLEETFLALRAGKLSEGEFIGANLLRIVGAILLMLPGVLSDLLGVMLQFGVLGGMAFRLLYPHNPSSKESQRDERIIDVEVIEIDQKKDTKD